MEAVLSNLYHLIHTLTDKEKEQLQNHSGNRADQLGIIIETIENTSFFDEALLLSKFKTLELDFDTMTINQCLEVILNGLNYPRTDTAEEVQQKIRWIKLLFDKRQFDIALGLLNDLKERADQYNFIDVQKEILYFEKMFILHGYLDKSVEHNNHEQIRHCETMTNIWEYRKLNFQAMEYEGRVIVRGDRGKRLSQLLKNPLLQDESKALSFDAKMIYNAICASIYRNQRDYNRAAGHYKRMIELYNSKPYYIKLKWTAYLGVVNNFANIALFLKQYDEALKLSDQLKNLVEELTFIQNLGYKHDVFIRAYFIEIQVYNEKLELEKASQLIPKINKCLEEDANTKLMYRLGILQEIAYTAYYQQDYDLTLSILDRLLSNKQSIKNLIDIHIMSMILKLLIYIESGQYEYLESNTHLVKKFIREKKIKTRYEILAVDFVESFLKSETQNAATVSQICQEYHNIFLTILPLIEDDAYFDIISWMEAQIEGVPMIELLRKKKELTVE